MVVRNSTCKSSVCSVPIPSLLELPLPKISQTYIQYLTRNIGYKKTKCYTLVLKERRGTTAALAAEGSVDWELKSDSSLIASSSNNNDAFCGFLWLQWEKGESGRFSAKVSKAMHCIFLKVSLRITIYSTWSQIQDSASSLSQQLYQPPFLSTELSAEVKMKRGHEGSILQAWKWRAQFSGGEENDPSQIQKR